MIASAIPWPEPLESKESGRLPGVDGDGILRYRLGWEPILAVEVGIVRTVVAQLGKESPKYHLKFHIGVRPAVGMAEDEPDIVEILPLG
ncbi:hypothetical protein THAOC_14857, partial [Thalassiosira oceanica]